MSKPVRQFKVITETNNCINIAAKSELQAHNLWNVRYGKMMGKAIKVTEVKPNAKKKKFRIGQI